MADVSYSICEKWNGEASIHSMKSLKRWIRSRATRYQEEVLPNSELLTGQFDPESDIGGFQYWSSTFSWSSQDGCFRQWGSGPSYFGGLYTLSTCAWPKRATNEYPENGWGFDKHFTRVNEEYDLYQPQYPVVIFNSGKCETDLGDDFWVTSVAFITHAFETMEGYAQYLLDNYEGEVVDHRLTLAENAPEHARKHGDCHADRTAATDGPPKSHDHHEGTTSGCDCHVTGEYERHKDNWNSHLKCLADEAFWHPFATPVFKAENRHGKIRSWNFESKGITEVEP